MSHSDVFPKPDSCSNPDGVVAVVDDDPEISQTLAVQLWPCGSRGALLHSAKRLLTPTTDEAGR